MKNLIYTVFAGVNGAGKSSLFNNLIKSSKDLNLGERINTDEIVREIGDWKVDTDQVKAGKIAITKIKSFLENKITFNQETTLSGNYILKTIKKAKEIEYKVDLHFVYVDSVEVAKERVNKRVRNGGHGIEEKAIERRFIESRENLFKIAKFCDSITVYDNTNILTIVLFIKNGKIIYKDKNLTSWLDDKKLNLLK